MNLWMFAAAALLLSPERIAYAVIVRAPARFRSVCRAVLPCVDPVNVLVGLFVGFKLLQALVFVGWCVLHGHGLRPASTAVAVRSAGLTLLVAGQLLNLSVFARLGRAGVFYGNRLGHDVQWRQGFPFSWFRHPQYVGTVLSICGFFVVMRYPEPDWSALPLLETLYYVVGSRLERDRRADGVVGRS